VDLTDRQHQKERRGAGGEKNYSIFFPLNKIKAVPSSPIKEIRSIMKNCGLKEIDYITGKSSHVGTFKKL